MPIPPHSVSKRLPLRVVAAEHLQFAPAVIVEPFDTPLARCFASLENFGWLRHRVVLPMPD
jgi:hypothetical protein